MPKQIKLQDVVDKMARATIARAFASLHFTTPEALLLWGYFQGIDATLRLLFERKELSDLARRHPKALQSHEWSNAAAVESFVGKMRVELMNAGMEATKRAKELQRAFEGQEKVVELLTEVLKRWEPGAGDGEKK